MPSIFGSSFASAKGFWSRSYPLSILFFHVAPFSPGSFLDISQRIFHILRSCPPPSMPSFPVPGDQPLCLCLLPALIFFFVAGFSGLVIPGVRRSAPFDCPPNPPRLQRTLPPSKEPTAFILYLGCPVRVNFHFFMCSALSWLTHSLSFVLIFFLIGTGHVLFLQKWMFFFSLHCRFVSAQVFPHYFS